jgi:amino acid adenylation domain-containing protein
LTSRDFINTEFDFEAGSNGSEPHPAPEASAAQSALFQGPDGCAEQESQQVAETVTSGFWMSPQQKQVWTLQQEGSAYRSACLLMADGPLSADSLGRALRQLVTRHEILRTVYLRQPGMKYPFQVVLASDDSYLQTVDLSGMSAPQQTKQLDELFAEEQLDGVAPERGPVLAAKLVTLGNNHNAIILSLPALAGDRSSLHVLAGELAQFVANPVADEGDEPLRYVQFAQWQNDLLESAEESSRLGREFWNADTDVALALSLPNEQKVPASFFPQSYTLRLDGVIAAKVDSLAARMNATYAEILLAAWKSLLWRLTGQSSFKVGVVFDGREYDELRDAVGLIEKTLPVEARFDGDLRFREVVEHVRASLARLAEWQEHYVPGAGFGEEPPVSFEYSERHKLQPSGPVTITVDRAYTCVDRFKLKLLAVRDSSGLTLEFHFDGSRLGHDEVERVGGYFQLLLAAGVSDPEAQVSRLALLPEAERRKLLVDWNQTAADYPRSKTIHELFEAQAALSPDRPALRYRDCLLSYRDLNERANQMAHYLRSLGVGADSLVGLCVERSAEMMIALLGILKAGGAYVPLNPDNPKPRLAQQLAGAIVLITEQTLLDQMPEFARKTVCMDRDQDLWSRQPCVNPANSTKPDNLVYVIYTSGSTGVPKGVAVRHRNLVNYSHFIARRLDLDNQTEGLHFGTVSTIGADLGNTCIYPALLSGGCLHVISYEVSTDAQQMAAYNAQYPVDVLKIVPSHLHALLDSPQAAEVLPRRCLVLGGETFMPKLAERLASLGGSCEVFNHYGPTETTIGSLTLRLAEYDWKKSQAASIPIGKPIANTQIFILDPWLQPVPAGVVGELFIAGDGVTAGYLNQPQQTAERFVTNPFSSDPAARMYRTGDLARYLADGNVEFLGRGDDQVKIRGFRIELGEIESALTGFPGVKQAVVLAKEDERQERRLVAYVAAESGANAGSEALRAHLRDRLPEFMVPSAIVALAKIPLNPNGKVDRQALPEPESVQERVFVAPSNESEAAVASIWQEVLRRDRIGTDENFFEMGGHSLMATQVISRVRERLKVELPIRALFEHPTIAGLAKAVESADSLTADSTGPSIVRVSREAYRANRN